jgi:hypothetical protein
MSSHSHSKELRMMTLYEARKFRKALEVYLHKSLSRLVHWQLAGLEEHIASGWLIKLLRLQETQLLVMLKQECSTR